MPIGGFSHISRNYNVNSNPESAIYSVLTIIGLALFVFIYFQIQKRKFDFKKELFLLTAFVLKSNGKVNQEELKFVYSFFKKNFNKGHFHRDKQSFEFLLSKKINISNALNRINNIQRYATKLQLLHFLVRITIIDSFLKNSEYQALQIIAKGLNITKKQLDAIFAMYNHYTTENESKKSTQSNVSLKIKQAYTILELSESATEKDIKKAYRKLVVLYHPDKLLHLDKSYQSGEKKIIKK